MRRILLTVFLRLACFISRALANHAMHSVSKVLILSHVRGLTHWYSKEQFFNLIQIAALGDGFTHEATKAVGRDIWDTMNFPRD